MAEVVWYRESGGWEWADFYVYQHPHKAGRYAVDTDSGCSCFSYNQPSDEELGAMNPLNKAEVIEEWKRFTDDNDYYYSPDSRTAGIESLQTTLPSDYPKWRQR